MRLFLSLSLIFLVSCASRQAGWEKNGSTVSLSSAEQTLLKQEAMKLWSQRSTRDSLEQALSKLELVHGANPSELETLNYLTRGYYFLADAHMDNGDEKKKTYEKAASFGEKAMATNQKFKESVSSGKAMEQSLGDLTEKEVPAMYWTAASLGKWAKASGIAAQLKYKTRIKALIERVEKLNPDFFFAAPSRYWGAFYAVAPAFAGGDLNKSREQFDKSLKMAPEYLGTKVLMAEVYWTKKGDKARFKKELEEVLASRFDQHKELGPENTMEKKKAQKLLNQIDELF